MIVTKKDLIIKVAEATGFMQTEVRVTVEQFLHEIGKILVEKKQVHIRGFGSFRVVHQKPRMGRNVKTGEAVPIPARYTPRLKFSKVFKARINGKINE